MLQDFDKNGCPIIWTGSNWVDANGNNVTTNKIAMHELMGTSATLPIDSTGVHTLPVNFTADFETALAFVELTMLAPSATDAVIDQVYVSNKSVSGFDINIKVGTASATAGATVTFDWKAKGN